MIERIKLALAKTGVSVYQISETKEESVELFFIRKSLDMRRRKAVKKASVTVYREFSEGEKRYLGSSSTVLQDSLTDEEIEKQIASAWYAASFVKNLYYELPEGERKESVHASSGLADKELAESAQIYAKALFAEDTEEDVFLNSTEVFLKRTWHRIVNSRGIDVSYVNERASGEFVVQCIGEQDVETYVDFAYHDLETEALRRKVRAALEQTRARASAVQAPPAGNYRVILSGDYVPTLLSYYVDRAGTAYVYQKYSNYEVGCKVQGEEVCGDAINLTLKATVPYSGEGIALEDRELVKDGSLQLLHGGIRFAYYLGVEPTGHYDGLTAKAGTVSLEEMKQQPYLHVVNFSDFQMDSFSGHFGGEIRLAYWFDGEKVVPVTGGSINGSILDVQKNLTFSKELQTEKDFEGPMAVCMEGISVAGSEE
ncbi:MAG: hypothetical protein IJY09_02445 [Lachnospiraceae bacterium]|nr:hypothetical protein [Lachnospiraceae bacterium]